MKKIYSLMLVIMMLLSSLTIYSTNVFAAELETPINEEIIEEDTYYNGKVINSTSWTTIAIAPSGFNCDVFIRSSNPYLIPGTYTAYPTNIRMLDSSGNQIWVEYGAIPGLGSRTFWCGSDVYKIQAMTQGGSASIYFY